MSTSIPDNNVVPTPIEVITRFAEEVLNNKNVQTIDEIAAADFAELDPFQDRAPAGTA